MEIARNGTLVMDQNKGEGCQRDENDGRDNGEDVKQGNESFH